MTDLYPASPKHALTSRYLGKSIRDVPTPAAVIDVAAVKNNCTQMLDACEQLQLEWRAHVKTHKTVEMTRLQVGTGPRPAKIIVSTIAEAEFLQPLLEEYVLEGRPVNVLYGLPLGPSQIPRLAIIARALGKGSISFLIDHPAQLRSMRRFVELSGVVPLVHIKIDMGGRRAGVIRGGASFDDVVKAALEQHEAGYAKLSGLYSHAGHSYGGDSQVAAMSMLRDELSALKAAAEDIIAVSKSTLPPFTLSIGATPTALSIQNMLDQTTGSPAVVKSVLDLHGLIGTVKENGHIIEIHAGVYPTLDLQQLAAHSLSKSLLSWSSIAFTVVAEVLSLYPGRGASSTPEALIGAGGLALGREFCKAYSGMAMLTPWNRKAKMPECDVEEYKGWIVGRFAQEHGILTWEGEAGEADELEVGQKVRLWPNHACITSSHFGWYFVVDSSRKGKEDEIVDVWTKARGW